MRITRCSLFLAALVIAAGASAARSQQLQSARPSATTGSETGLAPAPLVLILDPAGEGALSLKGSGGLDASAGAIHANSTAPCAIKVGGSTTMSAAQTSVVGGACAPEGAIVGPVQEAADVIPDPLAGVLPTLADWNAFKASLPMPGGPAGAIATSGTFDPGYYPGGLDARSGMVIQLNPGSYMFGNHVKLGGSAVVTGAGVTLFLDQDVELGMRGGGAVLQLTPPGAGDLFHGITLFTHRETVGSSVCKFGGSTVLEGVVYVPGGELVIAGGKEMGAIIAWQASISGPAGFIITGKGVPLLGDASPP